MARAAKRWLFLCIFTFKQQYCWLFTVGVIVMLVVFRQYKMVRHCPPNMLLEWCGLTPVFDIINKVTLYRIYLYICIFLCLNSKNLTCVFWLISFIFSHDDFLISHTPHTLPLTIRVPGASGRNS